MSRLALVIMFLAFLTSCATTQPKNGLVFPEPTLNVWFAAPNDDLVEIKLVADFFAVLRTELGLEGETVAWTGPKKNEPLSAVVQADTQQVKLTIRIEEFQRVQLEAPPEDNYWDVECKIDMELTSLRINDEVAEAKIQKSEQYTGHAQDRNPKTARIRAITQALYSFGMSFRAKSE